jgi:glycogen debranching enzyme
VSPRRSAKAGGPTKRAGAVRAARRLWPYVMMAWERWQALSPEDRERYKRQARQYAQRGRQALGRRPRR